MLHFSRDLGQQISFVDMKNIKHVFSLREVADNDEYSQSGAAPILDFKYFIHLLYIS